MEPQILAPGNYVVEWVLAAPVDPETVLAGLARLGFLDAVVEEPVGPSVRFVGRLDQPLAIANTPRVEWNRADAIGIPFHDDTPLAFVPFEFKRGTRYEMRFFCRLRDASGRAATIEHLAYMGFAIETLGLVQQDMRLPGREKTSTTQWIGIARWIRGDSCATDNDPFFFEQLAALPSSATHQVVIHSSPTRPNETVYGSLDGGLRAAPNETANPPV